MPIPTRLLIIDEPPTETNGSGIPVIGAIPIVIPTLTNTWKRKREDDPAGDDRAEEVARAGDDLEPAPDDEQVEQQQERGAEEAALLGERGEREVGVVRRAGSRAASGSRRRRRGPRSPPEPTAIIDWVEVVGGRVARVGRGVREAGEARRLVGLEHVDAGRGQPPEHARARPIRRDRADQRRGAASARPRRRARRRARRCRRARCRRRAGRRRAGSARAASAIAFSGTPSRSICLERSARNAGEEEREQHLAELGGLEGEEADVDPPLRAARGRAEDEHERHHRRRGDVDRPSRSAGRRPGSIRLATTSSDQPGGGVERLAARRRCRPDRGG